MLGSEEQDHGEAAPTGAGCGRPRSCSLVGQMTCRQRSSQRGTEPSGCSDSQGSRKGTSWEDSRCPKLTPPHRSCDVVGHSPPGVQQTGQPGTTPDAEDGLGTKWGSLGPRTRAAVGSPYQQALPSTRHPR